MEPTDAFPHWQTSCVEGRDGPCTGHRRAGACAVRRAPPLDVCVPVWVAPARGGRSRADDSTGRRPTAAGTDAPPRTVTWAARSSCRTVSVVSSALLHCGCTAAARTSPVGRGWASHRGKLCGLHHETAHPAAGAVAPEPSIWLRLDEQSRCGGCRFRWRRVAQRH